jgi:hypothetical protein
VLYLRAIRIKFGAFSALPADHMGILFTDSTPNGISAYTLDTGNATD